MEALTSLRNNTYKLLAKFSPDLDPAFVAHRAMLPNPDDAGDLLNEIISGELNSILINDDVSQLASSDNIYNWVESSSFKDVEMKLKGKRTTTVIDNAKRKLWLDEGYISLLSNELDAQGERVLSESEIKDFDRFRLKESACAVFTPDDFTKANSNEEFSILTHHRRNYLTSSKKPTLSLGTVVRSDTQYMFCIQQRCDSVRIPIGEQRKFLFLPMEPKDKRIDVVFKNGSQDYVGLSASCNECHALEIIKFSPLDDCEVIQAQKGEDELYYFLGGEDGQTKFQWILDLKEAHAQKIANCFAANLARVGLDESEWLRRT